MTTPNLDTVEIKAFVPAKDFELSKRFYQALGFTMPFSDDDLAYLHCGECSFLLQNFHVPEHTANFQMHLLVQDVDAWHAHVINERLAERFGVPWVGDPRVVGIFEYLVAGVVVVSMFDKAVFLRRLFGRSA